MRRRWALIIITVALTANALILSDYQQSGHLLAARAFAQHPPVAGPNEVNTEIDNATTTVLRIRLAPHEKTPMHDVSARLVWLTDAHLRDTAEDGTTIDYYRTAGAVDIRASTCG